MNFATYNQAWLEEIRAQKEYIARSGVHDKVKSMLVEQHAHKTPMLPMPLLFDRQTFTELASAGLLVTSAQTKILQHLCRQHSRAELLRRFDIPVAWEWMVNWDVLTSGAYTISRIDVLPANDGYYFCELNPDSSVGGPEVADWLQLYCNAVGWPLAEPTESPQHATVRMFRRIMEEKGLERIVICDWSTNRGNGYFGFDMLRQNLARALPDREIHHVFNDEYRDAWLDPKEGRRTLLHRGFMFGDMKDDGAFLRRLCDSGATIINTFETEIRMHKSWFAIFCDPSYHHLLSSAEVDAIKRYIPHTVAVDSKNLEDLLRQKAGLVFKLNASSGGEGVMMGAEHSDEHLRAAIEAKGVERWSAQKAIPFDGVDLPFTSEFQFTRHNIVLGVFLIDGVASGMLLRASSRSKVVNISSGAGGYGWAVPVTPDEQAKHLAAMRRARQQP